MSISHIVRPPNTQRNEGKILTPDGLHFICEAKGYDPEKIGIEKSARSYCMPAVCRVLIK